MLKKKKVAMAVRTKTAFCMVDPEEPRPEGARPVARMEEQTGPSSTYQTSTRLLKGHYRSGAR